MTRRTYSASVRRSFYGFLAVVLIACGGAANYLRPLTAIAATQVASSTQTGADDLAWPSEAEAAIGAANYGVLDTHGGTTPLPTASIAKVITSLAVLKQQPIAAGSQGATITLTDSDVAIYNNYVAQDGSVALVSAGEQITEYQALEAMLLPSANNMADSLAIWAFGSLANYTTFANQFVQQLGLTQTTVGVDASGLSPSTVSSPSDLVKLGLLALQNPVIAQIVAQPTATIPVAGVVTNVNWLVGKNGITGIKTGNSDQAGGCYLFSADYSPLSGHSVTIVGAVMGAKDLSTALDDAQPLLTSAEHNFVVQTEVQADQKFGSYKTAWASEVANAVAQSDVNTLIWKGGTTTTKIVVNKVDEPLQQGAHVGSVTITTGTSKSTVPLILQSSIPAPSFWWRLIRF